MMTGACWAGPALFAPFASAARGALALRSAAGRFVGPFGAAGAGAGAAATDEGGGEGEASAGGADGADGAKPALLAQPVWAASTARVNTTKGARCFMAMANPTSRP